MLARPQGARKIAALSVSALLALVAGTAHADHQLRGYVSQSGLDFISEQIPALVPKSALSPDQIVGMDAIMAEAIATKFMSAPLTKEQIAQLVRMPVAPQ